MACGKEFSKAGMTRHFDVCPDRGINLKAIEAGEFPVETIWHLRVQDAYAKDFWLDLEMRGSATLEKLDQYLRAIWLECCGHLSEFIIGGWGGSKIGKARKADQYLNQNLFCVICTILARLPRRTFSLSILDEESSPQNIPSNYWRATISLKCCVRNVTIPPVGCVWNASLKPMREVHGSYAMSM
jgi:hypothetical protein